MPIFLNDITMRDLNVRSGDAHSSQPLADHFTKRLQSKMEMFGKESETKTAEFLKDIDPAMLREASASKRKARSKEAEVASKDAVKAIAESKPGPRKIVSLGQLSSVRQKKKEQLQKARRSLERSQELYKEAGSSFTYNRTGYTNKVANPAEFASTFDKAVEERKQAYAKQYGFDSFESMGKGYAVDTYSISTDEETGAYSANYTAGQRDVMDMVMADITGMDYEELAQLNTFKLKDAYLSGQNVAQQGQSGDYSEYTSDQMAVLKDFYIQSNVQAVEAANERAKSEDANRAAIADAAKKGALKTQSSTKQLADQEIGKSLENVQLQLRELDEQFMKDVKVFQGGKRKRKVSKVDFGKDRPV
jgi:hypothetical protein